jgi:trehalose-phosphatase
MLDYDGTLGPFTVDRDNAVPYPGVAEMLDKLTSNGGSRLIVISGRPIALLKRLLNMKNQPEMWGCHGAERLSADGRYSSISLPDSVKELFSSIESWVVENGFDDNLEIKPFGLAFHWREAGSVRQREIEAAVRSTWEGRLAEEDFELKEFDGGLEARNRHRNKSNAVRSILSDYHDDFAAAYLGDDHTDEDAFKALGEKGLKILVHADPRPTAADIILSPPDELMDFLAAWLDNSAGT